MHSCVNKNNNSRRARLRSNLKTADRCRFCLSRSMRDSWQYCNRSLLLLSICTIPCPAQKSSQLHPALEALWLLTDVFFVH
ncbi:hypothetical protein Plhal710r2_c066g0175141 [Plasmopara halstedii]